MSRTYEEVPAAEAAAGQADASLSLDVGIESRLRTILSQGIPVDALPPSSYTELDTSVPHAPPRRPNLSAADRELALANALRYFPSSVHEELAPEFARELDTYGHIYMHRFRPREFPMRAFPLDSYPARSRQAATIMLMIMNNLDPQVAQYPHELVTYGGNGSVFQNWAQFRLVMQYLSEMGEDQTLVVHSGHPVGLFPSSPDAPRLVVTNGMMIPNYSTRDNYERLYALGVTQYGQMTAGSYCYIGPQGIVHGTTLTVLNAARKYLGRDGDDIRGTVYVSSGLGGMSGAQPKAGDISGMISVTAEVNEVALMKRHRQGWVKEVCRSTDEVIVRIRRARAARETTSIAFLGNIVALWEALADEADRSGERLADLGSDQTSLHNPYSGGYYPVQLGFEEAQQVMVDEPERFRELVRESLRRHVAAVNRMVEHGMRFWDYGNAFLLEASRAGADISPTDPSSQERFRYPSYVQDIMGDIFSLGFGPFRWVCTSGREEDLLETDRIAAEVIERLMGETSPEDTARLGNYHDNLLWIRQAAENALVVGSQARILYADALGRQQIALAFNAAVESGRVSAPIALSRDHHDVSGTDSPFRETSNITDGSQLCADMAVQNAIGDASRGATWVALHNGGGTGWGEAVNGGFGLVLDGTDDASRRAELMLGFDVNHGVARRAWSRHPHAESSIRAAMQRDKKLRVTLPEHADPNVIARALKN